MKTHVIEGEWSGYTASQRRICYREYTTSKKRIEEVVNLRYIRYSDGTGLALFVREKPKGKKLEELLGYKQLISACIRHGVNAVNDLPKDKK